MKDLNLIDHFIEKLPADPILENTRRQVKDACFSYVTPKKPANPKLIHVSENLRNEIGFSEEDVSKKWFTDIITGKDIYPNTKPYAMCYGGHQFGHWAGQLGDGRAINLFTLIHQKKEFTLQLKGAGETPYSRTADGLAVLRSSIREHLCSEAMYHLGVPTTRSLSLALSGDNVLRDMLYNGNAAYEKGAIVCRVAPTFLRFGNFELLAARQDKKTLQQLVEYTILHFYKDIKSEGNQKVVDLFKAISDKTLDMILHWQRVGFVHGVMNTDNFSILGLTIDYGPYGWLEEFDPNWTPNTTDKQNQRYRFGWQPKIAQWNLLQLANAFFFLTDDAKPLEEIVNDFAKQYAVKSHKMMKCKVGLYEAEDGDEELIERLIQLLYKSNIDYTLFFRELSSTKFMLDDILQFSSYTYAELTEAIIEDWKKWFSQYKNRLQKERTEPVERVKRMKKTNPKYVFRNYMAYLAIEAADKGDYTLIEEFYNILQIPYEEQPNAKKWYAKKPIWAANKVGCSQLSCSS